MLHLSFEQHGREHFLLSFDFQMILHTKSVWELHTETSKIKVIFEYDFRRGSNLSDSACYINAAFEENSCSKNSVAESIDPWGTPTLITNWSDEQQSITTRMDISLRKSASQEQSWTGSPWAGSLPIRLPCQTLSKAFETSSKTASASLCISMALLQMCVAHTRRLGTPQFPAL